MRANATQSSPVANPYLQITVGGDIYTTGGGSRLLDIKYDEQVYGGEYVIDLDNDDAALDAKTYEGQDVVTYFGFMGDTGSYLHKLKVEKQEAISVEGKLVLRLTCFDSLGKLSMYQGSVGGSIWNHPSQSLDALDNVVLPSGEPLPDDLKTAINAQYDITAWGIIQAVIADTINVTVTKVDDDGYINTLKPQVNASDARSVIFQALRQTKSYLRLKTNTFNLDVIQPDAHATVYSFDTDNLHFSDVEERAAVVPNKIVFHGIDADRNLISTGGVHGENAASIALLGEVIEHNDYDSISRENSTTQDEVDDKADARLAKLVMGLGTGTIIAPMHCSLELFDKVSITDSRYATPKTFTGYVFRIIREYSSGVYKISVQLGGVESGYTPSTGVDTKVSPTTPVTPPISTEEYILPSAVQGYHHDITFTAEDHNSVRWSSGTIKFYDGTTQAISSDSYNMSTGSLYYIYFDTEDADPDELKVTTNYLSHMSITTGLVCIMQRASDSDILATVIPSYGKEPLITADVIDMSGLLEYDYGSGQKLQRIYSTQIYAGYLKLTGDTKKDGEWYDESGVIIHADDGITIYGTSGQAFRTRATASGTDQCYVGTDGSIRAGAGAVKLSVSGLDIIGYTQLIKFRLSDGDTIHAAIELQGYKSLSVTAGLDLILAAENYVRVYTPVFRPYIHSVTDLGHSSYRWNNVYANVFRPRNSSTLGGIILQTSALAEAGSLKWDGAGGLYVHDGSDWRHIT